MSFSPASPLPPRISADHGWLAALDVVVEDRSGVSRVASQRHQGPLHIQRAFHPERDGTCHLYVLHPPGGVVQGDTLTLNADIRANARALLTTPSAAKFYRTPDRPSAQRVTCRVADGAALEWLPHEAIVFDGARTHNRLRFELVAGARLIAWDMVCLGRPAAGERLARGDYRNTLELHVNGRPLLRERLRVPGAGESGLADAPWGLAGEPVMGTLIAYGFSSPAKDWVNALCDAMGSAPRTGVTEVDGVVIVRALAADTAAVRERLIASWRILRRELLGKDIAMPRIWAT